MSNALAIAGVTAVLNSLLDSLTGDLTAALGSGFSISSVAPENVAQDLQSPPCLNLFLYQVTPNAALRNTALPSVSAAGSRSSRPPLALDLHYLLTAYGSADLQAEVLLGYGMQVFHENPVLTRETVRRVLVPNPPPPMPTPLVSALAKSGLADQLELVKLSLTSMSFDELSKLWTALKAEFRPSAAYLATVVLIESDKPSRSPLPVLSRGPVVDSSLVDPVTHLPLKRESGVAVQGSAISPFPELESFTLKSGQVAAVPGDMLTLSGQGLTGVAGQFQLLLSNARLNITLPAIAPEAPAPEATDSSVSFTLTIPADSPAGIYAAAVQLTRYGEAQPRVSNVLPLVVAPCFAVNPLPASVALGGASSIVLTPNCRTELRPGQRVSLIVGSLEVPADPFTAPTTTPSFTVTGLQAGTYRLRLRVDGIDSVFTDRTQYPAVFAGPQLTVTP